MIMCMCGYMSVLDRDTDCFCVHADDQWNGTACRSMNHAAVLTGSWCFLPAEESDPR